jgi:hypothetical protein
MKQLRTIAAVCIVPCRRLVYAARAHLECLRQHVLGLHLNPAVNTRDHRLRHTRPVENGNTACMGA